MHLQTPEIFEMSLIFLEITRQLSKYKTIRKY